MYAVYNTYDVYQYIKQQYMLKTAGARFINMAYVQYYRNSSLKIA